MKKRIKILAFSFIIVIIVAFLGSLFTADNTKSQWYESIKPSITPPNFVFPIVWTALFVLIAFSLFFSWTKARKKKKILSLYGINFVLNILWSAFFFSLRQPIIAFIDLILLWITILLLIKINWKNNKKAAWLLVPYLIWVTFAGVLNFLIAF